MRASCIHSIAWQPKMSSLGDAAIVRGDRIVLKMESANRDPLKFDAPDRLDITRRPAGNLGFGTARMLALLAAVTRTVLGFITPDLSCRQSSP